MKEKFLDEQQRRDAEMQNQYLDDDYFNELLKDIRKKFKRKYVQVYLHEENYYWRKITNIFLK